MMLLLLLLQRVAAKWHSGEKMLFDASARGLNCAIYGKTVLELLELGWSVPTFTDAPQEPGPGWAGQGRAGQEERRGGAGPGSMETKRRFTRFLFYTSG